MAVPEGNIVEKRRKRRFPTGLAVRCTEAEKREIFVRAELANRSASRFLVELAVGADAGCPRSRTSSEELEIMEALVVQLRRIASNLQELASHDYGSAADEPNPPSPGEIDEAVLEVRGMLDQLRSRLA
jgi:hypothetical protein